MKYVCFLLFIISYSLSGSAQYIDNLLDNDTIAIQIKIDALNNDLKSNQASSDSLLIERYLELSSLYAEDRQFNTAIKLCDSLLVKLKKPEIHEINTIELHRSSVQKSAGKTDEAISTLLSLIARNKEKGYTQELGELHNQLAIYFLKMGELETATYHFEISIKYAKEIDDYQTVASSLMSLGNRYKKENRFEEAEKNYKESIVLCLKYNFKRLLAGNYNNLGSAYRMQGKQNLALQYFLQAVTINKEIDNEKWLSYNYNNIGNVYQSKGQYNDAIKYFNLSYDIKDKNGDEDGKIQTFLNLAGVYADLGDYNKAYEYQDLFINLKDSLYNVDRINQSKQLAEQFHAEQREAEIEHLNTQQELSEQKLSAQEEKLNYQNWLIGLISTGVFLVLIIVVVLIAFIRNRNRTNKELANKSLEIDRKNNEIISSINYAKRIQSSILPSDSQVKSIFNRHALFYSPKDIVSGDFYVVEKIGDYKYFGVVDCTGHGVPGAMVSLVASNLIGSTLKDKQILNPAQILNGMNEEIGEKINNAQTNVVDGMDMSLCRIDGQMKLTFAGAHQDCWIISKKNTERIFSPGARRYANGGHELTIIKGDRSGISISSKGFNFVEHEIQLEKGDKIFVTSDGFADQFGGPKNKKYKVNQLRDFLLNHASSNCELLVEKLERELVLWKLDNDQVDDICILIVEVE